MLKGSLNDLKTHYHNLGEQLGVALFTPQAIVNELEFPSAVFSFKKHSCQGNKHGELLSTPSTK
jgi:hypothetical protein